MESLALRVHAGRDKSRKASIHEEFHHRLDNFGVACPSRKLYTNAGFAMNVSFRGGLNTTSRG